MTDIELKKRHRATLRAAVTNRSKDVEEVISGRSVPDIDLDELQVAWDGLREKYDELKVVSAEVFELLLERNASEDDLAQDMEQCDAYAKKFRTIDFKCGKIFKERNKQIPGPHSLSRATRSVASDEDELPSKGRRKFKLPEIQFKKFDILELVTGTGNIRDWLPFWAQFKKVHDDPNIDRADKVDYLVQATSPGSRARQLVDSFPATGEHYPQIIESLQTRFGREDIQIEVYVRELLKLILNNAVNKNKIEIFRLYDQIETQLRSLETLGITSDKYAAILFPLIESCLPEELLRIWQRSVVSLCAENTERGSNDLEDAASVAGAATMSAITTHGQRSNDGGSTPVIRLGAKDSNITLEKRLKALMQFLRNEVENEQRVSLASESFGFREFSQSNDVVNSRKKSPKYGGSSKIPTAADLVNTETKKCVFCDSFHESAECFKAQSFPISKKKDIIKEKRACFRCLKIGHSAKKCRMRVRCIVCSKQHVTLMCPEIKVNRESDSHDSKENEAQKTPDVSAANFSSSRGFMPTLRARIIGRNGPRDVRILVDTGSERSYILKAVAEGLGLTPRGSERILHCLFGGALKEHNHNLYDIELIQDKFVFKMRVLDQPKICCGISPIVPGTWMEELRSLGIEIFDIHQSAQIDLLIGSDIAGQLFTGNRQILESGLVAIETVLGWTLMGRVPEVSSNRGAAVTALSLFMKEASITNLWELDVLGITESSRNKSRIEMELEAKQFFSETVEREPDGRYKVRLPWTEGHPPLPSNYNIARSRLDSCLKRLEAQNLTQEYEQVFRDWLSEGIIERVEENGMDPLAHYLPHRPVVKEGSTTRIRPVFDASAKEKNSPSLNLCLEKGVNLIEEIPNILIRFRENQIGVISDIKKAFLQISVNEADRNCLRFLWKDDRGEEICYRHKRVVFGVNSSSFLLGATIKHHLEQCEQKMPDKKETISRLEKSFYVDNCVTSVTDEKSLHNFIQESIQIMAEAKFDLRGWERTQVDEFGHDTQVLGLTWNNSRDTLSIKNCLRGLNEIKNADITKRVILSVAQKIFDPIGFTTPITVCPKILLQETWENSLGWDQTVGEEIRKEFLKWIEDLKFLEFIEIPRWIRAGKMGEKCTLHVFCDASAKAYACVIFLGAEYDQKIRLYLLASKSRVAPKKQISIPRLELLSATIASRLFVTVQQNLEYKMESYFWTDSTTVLSWITRREEWGVFVWNRVAEIRSLTPVTSWRHVRGTMNPADLPSRGCSTKNLLESQWWEGPEWLRLDSQFWPHEEGVFDEEEIYKEKKRGIIASMTNTTEDFWNFDRIEKYERIIRMIAWILRWAYNGKKENRKNKRKGPLLCKELVQAEVFVFKTVQNDAFMKNDPKLKGLEISKDNSGVMRLTTKISNRKDSENFRFPIILPNKHVITRKLVIHVHEKSCHVGVQGLIGLLREKYWVLGGRRFIRSIIGNCKVCRRFNSKSFQVPSPPLPTDRVREAVCFEITGVDLAGPLYLKSEEKVWIVLYTCAVYRAVHCELCVSLSTNSFISALRRFISRRGRPKIFYSDNGTNLVGTENAFAKLDWDKIREFSTVERITWNFNPPTASWWGGFWERIIGVLKPLLKKMLGRARLNYEELLTVVLDCESVINSRPLTCQSDDTNDLVVLTPNMFLRELTDSGVPDCDAVDASSLCKRVRNLQKLREDLRKRFRSEYLGQLQLICRKRPTREIAVNEIVLIGTDNAKRIDWSIGRVLELLPGKDGRVRLVRVMTSKGQLLRPVQRLFPLEMNVTSEVPQVLSETPPPLDNLPNLNESSDSEINVADGSEVVTIDETLKSRSGRVIKLPKRFID